VARRQKIPFRVPHGSDKQQVKTAALEAAAAVPFTLSMDGPRQPQVWLTEFGESALHFSLVVWLNAEATRRVGAVIAAYNWALHDALQQHGIAMPFPQRDVHVRSWVDAGPSGAADADAAPAPATQAPRDGGNDAVRDVRRAIAEDNRNTSPSQDPDAR
jgi:small-conductance mechanosensitive channel